MVPSWYAFFSYEILFIFVTKFSLGSAWSEYKKSGMVHSIPMPVGILEAEKLATPIFMPSTKDDQGAHDENILPEQGN